MSYDVRLAVDTGGEELVSVTEYRSPTYNLAPMFSEALGIDMRDYGNGRRFLDGMAAADALPIVTAALSKMALDPEHFRALNPPNGWGSYEGAVEFLQWLQMQCIKHPKATVLV